MSKYIEYYDYLNNDIIRKLNLSTLNKITPYNNNYIINLPNIPDYFIKKKNNLNNYENNKISKLKKKDFIKIYDLNFKMKSIMSKLEKIIKPGVNISEIDEYLYKNICKKKLFPSMFGYDNFPKSSSLSVNDIICHSVPYNYKLLEEDIVSVDVCGYNGFHTDNAHTYAVSNKVSGNNIALIETTKKCLYSAISICKEGVPYSTIGKIVEKIANDNGFQVIKKFRGHGIGKKLHMKPFIPNYNSITKNNTNKGEIMKIGDMFAIEPLLSSGNGKAKLLEDKYGYITDDNSNSAHFERVVLITENGYEILNDF
jgi:methionyl aminopeptidase